MADVVTAVVTKTGATKDATRDNGPELRRG